MNEPEWRAVVAVADGVQPQPAATAPAQSASEDTLDVTMPSELRDPYLCSDGLWGVTCGSRPSVPGIAHSQRYVAIIVLESREVRFDEARGEWSGGSVRRANGSRHEMCVTPMDWPFWYVRVL